jgi:hypothetical protein
VEPKIKWKREDWNQTINLSKIQNPVPLKRFILASGGPQLSDE